MHSSPSEPSPPSSASSSRSASPHPSVMSSSKSMESRGTTEVVENARDVLTRRAIPPLSSDLSVEGLFIVNSNSDVKKRLLPFPALEPVQSPYPHRSPSLGLPLNTVVRLIREWKIGMDGDESGSTEEVRRLLTLWSVRIFVFKVVSLLFLRFLLHSISFFFPSYPLCSIRKFFLCTLKKSFSALRNVL